MRRTLLGMSQEKLGEAIGLTFQQVQKYERGSNRISAGTLYRLGQVLDVPVSFFFDAYDDPHASSGGQGDGFARDLSETAAISRREARLLRLWRAAPGSVADEMLALLAALTPDLGDGDGHRGNDRTSAASSAGADDQRDDGPGRSGKPRRRHGAVWDPADIYRTAKPDRPME